MMGKTFTCRMRPLIALSLSAALAWTPVRTRAADTIYVVVSAQSPVRSLAQKDVLALYTGGFQSSATEIPWANCCGLPPVAPPCEPKISIMPITVPSRPSNGAAAAIVPSAFR